MGQKVKKLLFLKFLATLNGFSRNVHFVVSTRLKTWIFELA